MFFKPFYRRNSKIFEFYDVPNYESIKQAGDRNLSTTPT